MKRKIFKLGHLNVGDKFSFINLTNFRDTFIKRVSESGCVISGYMKRFPDDSWTVIQLGYSVSNDVEVYLLD